MEVARRWTRRAGKERRKESERRKKAVRENETIGRRRKSEIREISKKVEWERGNG